MAGDQVGVGLEGFEGGDEGSVAFIDGAVEAVVGGFLLGHLPDALDSVQLGRVGRQSEQLDAMAVFGEPRLTFGRQLVARAVVDDEEDLSARAAAGQLLEKVEEGASVE